MGQFYDQNESKIKKAQDKKDSAALRKIADEGARYGDERCLELIGEDYYYGRSVTTDYAKSFYYFSKAADGNAPRAWYHLGLSYWFAEGVKRDTEKAIECIRKEENDDGDRNYFLYAMTALKYRDENNHEMVGKIMKQMYDMIYKEYNYNIAAFAYAVYLIQGEAFPDAFEPCREGVSAEDKKAGMKILEQLSKEGYNRGYADYYLSLIYAGSMPPVVNSDSKAAKKHLNMSAAEECFPAAHTKSELFLKNRDTKVIYFYRGDIAFIGNMYGKVDDAIDKLGLMIANSHVHEFDRDMMMLHGYAQFEVDMDARITEVYGRDPEAVIQTKGPTMKKYVNGTPQPLYEAPLFNPDEEQSTPAASKPSSGFQNPIGSIADSLKEKAKNVDVDAVANAAGDAVNKAAEKMKGLFGKFKK